MTFEMEHAGHTLEIDHDRDWGMKIIGIKCPHERILSAIRAEIITYHKRDKKKSTAWFTIELIEKALDLSYFVHNSEESK